MATNNNTGIKNVNDFLRLFRRVRVVSRLNISAHVPANPPCPACPVTDLTPVIVKEDQIIANTVTIATKVDDVKADTIYIKTTVDRLVVGEQCIADTIIDLGNYINKQFYVYNGLRQSRRLAVYNSGMEVLKSTTATSRELMTQKMYGSAASFKVSNSSPYNNGTLATRFASPMVTSYIGAYMGSEPKLLKDVICQAMHTYTSSPSAPGAFGGGNQALPIISVTWTASGVTTYTAATVTVPGTSMTIPFATAGVAVLPGSVNPVTETHSGGTVVYAVMNVIYYYEDIIGLGIGDQPANIGVIDTNDILSYSAVPCTI